MSSGERVTVADLGERLAQEIASLENELGEIDMLLQQARTESARHEQKLTEVSERVASMSGRDADRRELAEVNAQLLTMTRRAAFMESQIDVLEGKRKVLARFRESLEHLTGAIGNLGEAGGPAPHGAADTGGGTPASLAPAVSRIVLTAQEDLRRDIARAMHDGPAQSLTNIVLQAEIVQHLIERDPEALAPEVRALVEMVQRTLDATKTFIFDVRPMVLDDLGLVPTLRRVTRDRSRRAQIPIEFDSVGQDRRPPIEVESAAFRILDEVIAGFQSTRPERIVVALDWSDRLAATVRAPLPEPGTPEPAIAVPTQEAPQHAPDLPPALAAMIAERIEAERAAAVPEVRAPEETALPAAVWAEVQQRAASIGAAVTLSDDGHEVRLRIELEAAGDV